MSMANAQKKDSQDPLQQVALRNAFYRDGQRKVLLILLVSLVINVLLGYLLFYQVTHPPAPQYFATSTNGRITPLYPLNRPNQPDYAVQQWASQAAIAAYSYNFVNYQQELQAASEFFTPTGWDSFLNALSQSRNLRAVIEKKLVVSAVATAVPTIIKKGWLYGDNNGPWSWRVQMPILVTYQSGTVREQENNIVTLLIVRVSTLNNPRGIGIEQFIVEPVGTGVSL